MELGTFKFKEVDPLVRLRGSVVSGLALLLVPFLHSRMT
jgi:hypothetical protein